MEFLLALIMIMSGLGALRSCGFSEEKGDHFWRTYKVLINIYFITFAINFIIFLLHFFLVFSLPNLLFYICTIWLVIEIWLARKRDRNIIETFDAMYIPYKLMFIMSLMFATYWLFQGMIMALYL